MKHEQLQLPLTVLRLIKCSAAKLDNPNHHLRQWKKRPFWMKVRIDQGPKFVGKDVYIPLKTRCPDHAREIRDGIMHGLKAGGFYVSVVIEPTDTEPDPQ